MQACRDGGVIGLYNHRAAREVVPRDQVSVGWGLTTLYLGQNQIHGARSVGADLIASLSREVGKGLSVMVARESLNVRTSLS